MSDGPQEFASLILPSSSTTGAVRRGETGPAGGPVRDSVSRFFQILDAHSGPLDVPTRARGTFTEHEATGSVEDEHGRVNDRGLSLLSLVLQEFPGEGPVRPIASSASGSASSGGASVGLIEGPSPGLPASATNGRHGVPHADGREQRPAGNGVAVLETLLAHSEGEGEVQMPSVASSASGSASSGGASVGLIEGPSPGLPASATNGRHGVPHADGREQRPAGNGVAVLETLLAHSDGEGELRGPVVKESPAGLAQRVSPAALVPADSFGAFRIPGGGHARFAADGREAGGDAQRLASGARSVGLAGAGETRAYNEIPGSGLLGDDAFPPASSGRPSTLATSELPVMQRQTAAQTLDRILIMSRKGADHARLQLSPPELGRVDIRLDLDGNDTRLQLTVQNAIARESMEAMLPKLREALQQQGLELLDASVSEQHEDQAQGGMTERDSDSGSPAVNSYPLGDGGQAENRLNRAVSIQGLVDAYA